MCGIAGIWGTPPGQVWDNTRRRVAAEAMAQSLASRGPDDSGVWQDIDAGLALAHRRLSILDLSKEGAQPMRSADGRYVIIFNGEIYNFVELRDELVAQGHSFRGGSDTEVLLNGIVAWGVRDTLLRANGMFAFALWDCAVGSLTLARDRLGKKPLYVACQGGALVFGSELKALLAVPDFKTMIDPVAARAYAHFGFIPGDVSIFEGVSKLVPGTVEIYSAPGEAPERIYYWRVEEVVEAAQAEPFSGDRTEAAIELKALIRDAVRVRCRSDVPLGAFLSGGIDSTIVTALMAGETNGPTRTYTIGFEDAGYDESSHARIVADALNCRHTEAVLGPDDLLAVAESLPKIFDEPFADVSQVPTCLVSSLARAEVEVCLSGDGGDEVFGGYHRHFMSSQYWPRLSVVPWHLRAGLSKLALALEGGSGHLMSGLLARMGSEKGRLRNPGDKLGKVLRALAAVDLEDLHEILLTQGRDRLPAELAMQISGLLRRPNRIGAKLGAGRTMMLLDTLSYLPDDILVKADRASMAVGLELRSPLLDYRVMEFAWRLPEAWLIDAGGKRILKEVLAGLLPKELFERPKMGFAVPIGDWLRGPLKNWAEQMLGDGYDDLVYSKQDIMRDWRDHQRGRIDCGHHLWRALMWQAWRESWNV